MHVKVGDTVKLISGRDKGKIGEITKVFKHNSSVIVKDINLKTKHVKSRGEDEPGQILKVIFTPLKTFINYTYKVIIILYYILAHAPGGT
jgi:ribosomal protein L24